MSDELSRTSAPIDRWLTELDAPSDAIEFIDARELPPPKPLSETLERLAKLDDTVTLVQLNDRKPKLLYPKLDDRGYTYGTIETEEGVVTAIWS